MNEDYCKECGRFTLEGKEKWQEKMKEHPIYGTDFSKPLSVIIEDIRRQIAKSRGMLGDISICYSGWGEQIKDVEGTLTSALINLHYIKDQMEKVEMYQKGKEK